MPKWDKTRNYYADLEVSPNASSEDIKKQFRKLALKYHPDRNPGREADVNSQFQIIQSAHEILTDDTFRRQYDEARRTYVSRFPTASGVRGNPWADIAKQYPAPPTRHHSTTAQPRPTSGAQRYASFTHGMPRAPRPPPRDDPQSRRSNADAWDNMRSSSTRRAPQTPGRAPTSSTRDTKASDSESANPRTAYQQQKAQASFGNRRSGYTPRSPGLADEPPVTNKNYSTTRTRSNLFFNDTATGAAPADPLSQFRETYGDKRHSTPYHSPGGEKTTLYDEGPGLSRSASTRAPRRPEMPGSFPSPHQRSSSTPRSSSNDGGSEDSTKVNTGGNGSANRKMPKDGAAFQSHASDRYNPVPEPNGTGPQPRPETAGNPQPASANANTSSTTSASSAQANNGPSVYATPFTNPSSPPKPQYCFARSEADRAKRHAPRARDWLSYMSGYELADHSSEGVNPVSRNLLPSEEKQRRELERLVNRQATLGKIINRLASEAKNKATHIANPTATKRSRTGTDYSRSSSFNFAARHDIPDKGAGINGLAKNSADNINTKFVQDEHPNWKFTAGSTSASEPQTPTKTRPPSRHRISRRQTPKSRPAPASRMPSTQESSEEATGQGFSASDWSEKIGSQHFEPQRSHSTSTSPSRRTNSKKSNPVKMTAGTAGLVDEDESEGAQETPQRPSSGAIPMDIDSPPAEKADSTPKASQTNGARNIPVEPHRAEWRAGDVNGVHSKSANPSLDTNTAQEPSSGATGVPPTSTPMAGNPFVAHNVGSEDTEEFRTTFSDFKKVEPFADPTPTGLKDFADLKSTLPFQSRPSEQIPVDTEHITRPLVFPTPPVAPRLPPTVAVAGIRPNNAQFHKYAQDFYQYMDKWEAFNSKILLHFTTRQENFKSRRQHCGSAWLNISLGDDAARSYLAELEQDQAVRKQWADAFQDHQAKVREFIAFRDQVR
ncbi:hypothetical protein F4779DRAFT_6531 [Xylariaceae sp. FL0662B]|nr:hypothetical protein F4779DRAFT_6531 [Xylariaceae sp. FL0662B]